MSPAVFHSNRTYQFCPPNLDRRSGSSFRQKLMYRSGDGSLAGWTMYVSCVEHSGLVKGAVVPWQFLLIRLHCACVCAPVCPVTGTTWFSMYCEIVLGVGFTPLPARS